MRTEWVNEPAIDARADADIRALLQTCFPGEECFRSRRYYKQLPHRRLLVRDEGLLVGHVAVDHRMIALGGAPAPIAGVIDLCVHPSWRGQGLGARLLGQVEAFGRESGAEFVVLFAVDDGLYRRSGYRRSGNVVRWLKIHEHRSLGMGEEVIDELMVKELGARAWPKGVVDLLGYQF